MSSSPSNIVMIMGSSIAVHRLLSTNIRKVDPIATIITAPNILKAQAVVAQNNLSAIIIERSPFDQELAQLMSYLIRIGDTTPTILVTTEAHVNAVNEALKLGITHYLLRPFKQETALNKLKACLITPPATIQ